MMPSAWHPAFNTSVRARPMNSSFCPVTRSPRPLRQPRPSARAASSDILQHRALSHGKDPHLTLVHGHDHTYYRVVLELPSSSHTHRTLEDVSAHVDKAARTLAVHGVVVSTPRVQEFVVRRHSALFATPSRARVAGMAPAGAYVVGARCEENPDWVVLEEGFLPLSVLQPVDGSQPTARRFVKEVALPDDANLEEATLSSLSDGAVFEVQLPRKRAVPTAMQDRPAPMREPEDAMKMNVTAQPASNFEAKGAAKVQSAPHTPPKAEVNDETIVHKTPKPSREAEIKDENIQMPMDCTEEWQAMPSGGFSRLKKTC
ncbi:hypothetical protein AB1Y20_017607 [Prymnesium parvum]